MRKLRFRDFCAPSAQCHFATARLTKCGPDDPHWHDFMELFWIDSGRGTHWINGQVKPLEPGMLVFIAAEDRHGFGAKPDETLTLINIAFPCSMWRSLRARYGGEVPDLFAPNKIQDREHHMTQAQVGLLRDAAVELRSGRLGAVSLDRFLLNVMWIVTGGSVARLLVSGQGTELPGWLSNACQRIEDQPHFVRGVWGFYDLCQRSPEHVGRMTRQLLGKTVSDIVNDARLNFMASQLVRTDRRILDIAMDCGLDLSRLHLLFRQRHGISPGVYRRRQQQIITAGTSHG